MTVPPSANRREAQQSDSGPSRGWTPMQEDVRTAIANLIPEKRRSQRQGWQRKSIVRRRTPAVRLLEEVVDEALRDGVADDRIEAVGLAIYDGIRRKVDERRGRPLGVTLAQAIREEEAVQGEMAAVQIEQITAPTAGGHHVLRYYYARHAARIRDCLRAIDTQLRQVLS